MRRVKERQLLLSYFWIFFIIIIVFDIDFVSADPLLNILMIFGGNVE